MTHALDMVFSALADPTRRAILSMLLEDDMAVTDVAEPFQMSLAAISKHLTILPRAGLIRTLTPARGTTQQNMTGRQRTARQRPSPPRCHRPSAPDCV